jgi:Helix-turn-helix of DDE superfamily endonuclease
MSWDKVSALHGKKFRRYTGIQRSLFEKMLNCVQMAKQNKRKHPTKGVKSSLSVENQLLITILYWREYRDQSHTAVDYGVSQSTICRTIIEIENILIKSGVFSLPGKKSIRSKESPYEITIVDVMETPTERPKKNKSVNTVAKRNAIL